LLNCHTVSEGAKLYSLATQEEILKWNAYVFKHPHGSVFHLNQWLRSIQSTFKHKPIHHVSESPDGEIIGILPLFLVRSRIFGSMLVSIPQAAYGGILADDQPTSDILLSKAQEIAQQEKVQFLEIRNFRESIENPNLLTKDLYVTFRQELFSDPEKNLLSIPRKTRAECREGIKNGLEFNVNAIGIDGFYQVYSRSVRDLGTPVFTKKLLSNGLREFGDQCKIFSVHWQGKLVSAVWTLFYKDEVIPYFGGSLREYNR
jgi:FemAB-related protein (PEP-CTERM system-associated)